MLLGGFRGKKERLRVGGKNEKRMWVGLGDRIWGGRLFRGVGFLGDN